MIRVMARYIGKEDQPPWHDKVELFEYAISTSSFVASSGPPVSVLNRLGTAIAPGTKILLQPNPVVVFDSESPEWVIVSADCGPCSETP